MDTKIVACPSYDEPLVGSACGDSSSLLKLLPCTASAEVQPPPMDHHFWATCCKDSKKVIEQTPRSKKFSSRHLIEALYLLGDNVPLRSWILLKLGVTRINWVKKLVAQTPSVRCSWNHQEPHSGATNLAQDNRICPVCWVRTSPTKKGGSDVF